MAWRTIRGRSLKFRQFRSLQSKLKNSSRGAPDNSNIPKGASLLVLGAGKTLKTAADMSALLMKKDEEHLIHEKLVIPKALPRLSRQRLLKLLADNLVSYNATIINGRAGTGKTALAADLALHAGRAVAWYKVDAADSDLRLFCEYLSTTLWRQRRSMNVEQLLQITESVESAIESEGAELLAEAFVFQLSEGKTEPLLIVIEDLHLVFDADWVVPFFRRLLPLLPTNVHMLITCRSLPPAPLWRLRSKQMLRVLEESELAFNLEEAISLFATYGLGEEAARIAWSQTNGRAVTIAEFAATPGRAGRAIADSLLSLKRSTLQSLASNAPDFQT
jgi:LuxR family maltose regulon positive regulatory protein